jgi:phosphatidylserine/phosphatidylglycerophosphate/cardiolipin synthase-like enzyme
MRGKFVLPFVVLAALGATGSPAYAGSKTPVTVGATEADVTVSEGRPGAPDSAILDHLVGLINRADQGSEIYTNIFDIDDRDVIAAINGARANGVTVWVTRNSFPRPDEQEPAATSRICLGGCIQADLADEAKAHSKYMVFTKTHRTPGSPATHAAWVSSSNLVSGAGGKASSNNAITYYEDTAPAGQYRVWSELKLSFNDHFYWPGSPDPNADYYAPETYGWNAPHSGFHFVPSANTYIQVSPDATADFWADAFGRITANSSCSLYVVVPEMKDNRPAPIDDIRWLAAHGCFVDAVVDYDAKTHAPKVSYDTGCWLKAGGVRVTVRDGVHDKLASFQGTFDGTPGRRLVFTGSHNWTPNAQRHNDEMLLTAWDLNPTAFGAFNNHAAKVWSEGVPITSYYNC